MEKVAFKLWHDLLAKANDSKFQEYMRKLDVGFAISRDELLWLAENAREYPLSKPEKDEISDLFDKISGDWYTSPGTNMADVIGPYVNELNSKLLEIHRQVKAANLAGTPITDLEKHEKTPKYHREELPQKAKKPGPCEEMRKNWPEFRSRYTEAVKQVHIANHELDKAKEMFAKVGEMLVKMDECMKNGEEGVKGEEEISADKDRIPPPMGSAVSEATGLTRPPKLIVTEPVGPPPQPVERRAESVNWLKRFTEKILRPSSTEGVEGKRIPGEEVKISGREAQTPPAITGSEGRIVRKNTVDESNKPYSQEEIERGNRALDEAGQLKDLSSLDEIWEERERRFESGEWRNMTDDERRKAEIDFEKRYYARLRLDLSKAPKNRIDYVRSAESSSFKVISSYSKLFPDGTILSEEKIEFGKRGGHEYFRVWIYPDGKSISWGTDDDTRRRKKEKAVSEETFKSESMVISDNPIIKHVFSASVSAEQEIRGTKVDLPKIVEGLKIPEGLREKLTELKQKYRHGPWEFVKDSYWLSSIEDRSEKPNYRERFLIPLVTLVGIGSFVLLIGLCFIGFELVKSINQSERVSPAETPTLTATPEGANSQLLSDEYVAITATAEQVQAQELIQQANAQIKAAEDALAIHDCEKGLPEARDAVDACTRAIELSPDNSEAHYCRARGYGLLEEIDKAAVDLQTALEIGLPGAEAEEAQRQLNEFLARMTEPACSISVIEFNHGWDSSGYPISPSNTCTDIVDRINVFWELNGTCNNCLTVKWKYNDTLSCYHYYEPGEHEPLEGSMYTSDDGGALPSGDWTVEVWDGITKLGAASCDIP